MDNSYQNDFSNNEVNNEVVNPEPVNTEMVQEDVTTNEVSNPEPVTKEEVTSEVSNPEPVNTESVQEDVTTNEVPNPEPVNTEVVKEEVSDNKDEFPRNEKQKKIQVIITIIVGILVLYAGIRTLVLVFLIPNQKDLTANGRFTPLTSEQQLALAEKVPYITNTMTYHGAYSSELVNKDNIEKVVLYNMALTSVKQQSNSAELDTPEYKAFEEQYCKEGMARCYSFLSPVLKLMLTNLYGEGEYQIESFQIGANPKNKCTLTGNNFFCAESSIENPLVIEKVSETILAKEVGDNIYVYERAIFLNGLSATLNDGVYNFNSGIIYKNNSSSSPTLGSNEELTASSLEEIYSNLLTKYESTAQIYKSTFKRADNGTYYWVSTEPVESTGS